MSIRAETNRRLSPNQFFQGRVTEGCGCRIGCATNPNFQGATAGDSSRRHNAGAEIFAPGSVVATKVFIYAGRLAGAVSNRHSPARQPECPGRAKPRRKTMLYPMQGRCFAEPL